MEWNGWEWSGMECTRVESNGINYNKIEWNELDFRPLGVFGLFFFETEPPSATQAPVSREHAIALQPG